MSVTKVGISAPSVSAAQQNTFQVTFTADSVFHTGDILVVRIDGHDSSLPGGAAFTAPAGTTWQQMTGLGLPLGYQYHVVTGGEDGSSSLSYTWTISGGVGISWWYGWGVALRSTDTLLSYASGGSVSGQGAGASPRNTTFAAHSPAVTGATQFRVVFRTTFVNAGSGKTAMDTAFPTSADAGPGAVDTWASVRYSAGAYQILAQGVDTVAAEVAVTTWSGGGSTLTTMAGDAAYILFDGVVPPTETSFPSPYEPISRRIDIGELPHEVNSPMFDDL